MRMLFLLVALVSFFGCNTATQDTQSSSQETTTSTVPNDPTSDDSVTYAYHRDAVFTDVTKNMPDGSEILPDHARNCSVDHIDFNIAAAPNVVVVVTVIAPRRESLSFTTTFTGDDGTNIKKDWAPSPGAEDDDHVGLFVLPASVTAGQTAINYDLP